MTTQEQPGGLTNKRLDEHSQDDKRGGGRPFVLGKINALLALLALLLFVGAYRIAFLSEVAQQARTVPVLFRDVLLVRGGRESKPAKADLRRGDHIRRIED